MPVVLQGDPGRIQAERELQDLRHMPLVGSVGRVFGVVADLGLDWSIQMKKSWVLVSCLGLGLHLRSTQRMEGRMRRETITADLQESHQELNTCLTLLTLF